MHQAVLTIRQGTSVIAEGVAATWRISASGGGLKKAEGELRMPEGKMIGVGMYDVTDEDGGTARIAIHRVTFSSAGLPSRIPFEFSGAPPK